MKHNKLILTILIMPLFLFSQVFNVFAEDLVEPKYSEILKTWEETPNSADPSTLIELKADTLGLPLASDEIASAYDEPSILIQPNQTITFSFTVDQTGFYTLRFDYAASTERLNAPEASLKIDGAYPYYELRRLIFNNTFLDAAKTFDLDRYGNETYIKLIRKSVWDVNELWDANFSQPYPLKLYLTEGTHAFSMTVAVSSVYMGTIRLVASTQYPTYEAYRASQQAPEVTGVKLTLQAEHPNSRNSTAVITAVDRDLNVTPYATDQLLMNVLGGDGWAQSGSGVNYQITVAKAGYYQLSFHAKQNFKSNYTVYRKIKINHEVPFEEANAFPFPYTSGYKDIVFGEGEPYQVYLNEGVNVITIEATDSPYHHAISTIEKILDDINTLSLEIRKLVGNQDNPFKEWVITNYIPDLQPRLIAMADELQADLDRIIEENDSKGSSEALSYQIAIDNLRYLAKEPDKVPNRMARFSEGSGSAAQLLGTVLPMLQEAPLSLDHFTLYSPDQVVKTKTAGFFEVLFENIKQFILSFTEDPYNSIGSDPDEIEVWVNRPRQYVDLLQSMVDEEFTKATGIKVKFSIMPNESKLVLANAANIQPDVALGVSTNVPYELAIRGALKDLRSFDDFDSTIAIYSPGALLGYIINDSVYAIPETQDFWVTFYRKDILSALNIPVPDTWEDVLEILPELQRYGMNFNTPLSSGSGMKGFLATAPYLYNAGALLYSADGFSTGIASEEAIKGVRFMAESFTIYGMPLTTSSFYNSFRYGDIPVGVDNASTYFKLLTAAPEIVGQWDIAPYPGTKQPDGSITRYATGSAQTCIMFQKTDQPEESWTFMKWWMSTATQTEFQDQLILRYGPEYLWSSANLEAFANNSFQASHKAVILAQWEWLQEPVRLPGSYMLERELSNVWNKIVFDGANPRVAIDRAVILINREITRKMTEFGYIKDGVVVKPYKIPDINTVKGWIENAKAK